MVANYFPPMASGGIARQLRFLRYLPECGWDPTVLSVRTQGPVPDPPGVRIERAAALDPERLYALGRRVAGPARRRAAGAGGQKPPAAPTASHVTSRRRSVNQWLQVPDEYVSWIVPAVLLGRRLLREEPFDAIFSSFPRASSHLVAAELARESGIPWVADYRDPWPTHQFRRYPTQFHRTLNLWLERWALSQASAVTAVNEPIVADLRRRYPSISAATSVIANGYDPEEDVDEVDLGPGFWFVHTGRIYRRTQQLAAFLEAFAALPDDVHVLLLGTDGPQITGQAAALGVAHRVHVEPFAPRARARGVQRAAHALLLITGRAPESLSSKLFEYLVAGAPVFAVTPPESVAAALIAEAAAGRCVAPDEPCGPALAAFVADARAGRLPAPDPEVVRRFDGRTLTRRLADLLDGLTVHRG
jgi:glycosyltransferase involved in cell wall biosynthesis